jgi:hypothetical protein
MVVEWISLLVSHTLGFIMGKLMSTPISRTNLQKEEILSDGLLDFRIAPQVAV